MDEAHSTREPSWQTLSPVQRRVFGVLVEKAKTTPDAYPLSLNAICNACNQKSNRYPLMRVEEPEVDEALEHLRRLQAVAEVQGASRVARYRHYAYEWLGVDKFEMAVITELLLRGAQTMGELRGRAARMEPIADLASLRPVLVSLKEKGLVVGLTPEGRGHVVTHALYQPHELKKLQTKFGTDDSDEIAERAPVPTQPVSGPTPPVEMPAETPVERPIETSPSAAPASGDVTSQIAALRQEMEALRTEVARLRDDLNDVWSNLQS